MSAERSANVGTDCVDRGRCLTALSSLVERCGLKGSASIQSNMDRSKILDCNHDNFSGTTSLPLASRLAHLFAHLLVRKRHPRCNSLCTWRFAAAQDAFACLLPRDMSRIATQKLRPRPRL